MFSGSIKTHSLISQVGILLITTVLMACANENNFKNAEAIQGRVISVVAENISEVRSFEVQLQSGEIYSFKTDGFIGFTPSHIKEHQITGEPVIVTYIERNGAFIASKITD